MTASLLERLRTALAPHYSVERELASGGMGTVFLGRDQGLDRPVAIKLLRPEIATAEHAERFLREARILARLSHPNIVPIHQVGEADGLFFYVMDYLTGETLYQRLSRGTLSPTEATSLALDLLAALDTAHRQGVVHRDLKPGNVFLADGRAVLTDFGIAKSLDPAEVTITGTDTKPGTLSYMAPEQLTGGAVSPRTDLYALGIVLFEAVTGRRWWIRDQQAQTDWSGVPGRLERVLRRALAWNPERRWAGAAEMRNALTHRSRLHHLAVALGLVAAALLAIIHWWPPPPSQLVAILPIRADPGLDTTMAADLTTLTEENLRGAIPLYSDRQATRYAEEIAADSGRSRHLSTVITGRLTGTPDALQLQLTVLHPGRDSRRLHIITGDSSARIGMSNAAATRILSALVPELTGFDPARGMTQNPQAITSFAKGLRAFREDRWAEAQRDFEQARTFDSNFAMAAWRLVNVRRWRRTDFGINLEQLYQRHGNEFRPIDRLLIRAQLARDLKARFALYQAAVDSFPYDGYTALLYADELFHRGPLIGVSLREGRNWFEHAVKLDSLLAPAYDHIIWGDARLGDSAGAFNAYQRMRDVVPGPVAPGDPDLKTLMKLILAWRFAPKPQASLTRWTDTAQVHDLIQTFRWGISFDIPDAQLEYGRVIDSLIPSPLTRASGHNGQGIALIALGRPAEAFAQFDSASMILDTRASDLLRAEWRVVPAALGLLPYDQSEMETGRKLLSAYHGDDSLGFRAEWALAVADLMAGDSASAQNHEAQVRNRVPVDPRAKRLDRLFDALLAGRYGHPDSALARSQPLLEWDSAGRGGDPFVRSVLHLMRGTWHHRLKQEDDARREWLWYQNTDITGWPGFPNPEVQTGEVDWAFGTLARYRQAAILIPEGRLTEACGPLARVLELWSGAEPSIQPQVDSARALRARCPP